MNNHPKVIEYSELPEKMAEEIADGKFREMREIEMKKIKIKVIETRKIKTLEVKVKVMKITISFCTMV